MKDKRSRKVVLIGAVTLAFGLLFLWWRVATPVRADAGVHCVNLSGSGCDAICGGGCYSSVQAAVDAASPGEQVRIAAGTYTDVAGTVASITKELIVHGGYDQGCGDDDFDPALYQTVLDAQRAGSVISSTNAGSVLLLHLTLTHGDGSGNCGLDGCGGGIYATDTNLHVGHCTIIDNIASQDGQMGLGGGVYVDASGHVVEMWENQIISNTGNTSPSSIYPSCGGGVFVKYSTVILQENEILNNVGSSAGTGGMGGGIYLYAVTHADVLSNTIQGNVATAHAFSGSGGGIYLWGLKAYLSGNRIEDNDAAPNFGGYGGGVYVAGQIEAHLTRNTIVSNTTAPTGTGLVAPGGGVLVNSSGPVTLSNNLIAGNFATANAGSGVYASQSVPQSPLLLVNNTIADNGDSGVVVWSYVDLTLQNNIIAGHTVGVTNTVPASSTVTADTNLFWNTSDPLVGVNAIQQNPLLAPDYHLQPGSPAVEAGLTIPWLVVDLDGNRRPQSDMYDLGAFERVEREVFLPLILNGYSPVMTPLFFDDFDHGTLANWVSTNGTWSNPGNYMRGEDTINAWNMHTSAGSDIVYEGTVTLVSGNAAGLVFRSSADGSSSYDVILDAKDGVFKISKRLPYQVLDSHSMTVQYNQPYKIKVVASGSTIEGYLDGVKRLTVTDTTYTSGRLGVILFISTATYDDLVAWEIP